MVHATHTGKNTECGIAIDLRYESAVDGSGAVRPVEVFRNINADLRCADCTTSILTDAYYAMTEGVTNPNALDAATAYINNRLAMAIA